jgi:hypothetical protein
MPRLFSCPGWLQVSCRYIWLHIDAAAATLQFYSGPVRNLIRLAAFLLISLGSVAAQAQRAFNQGELDALLAPVALYPDPILTHVLNASAFPQDVAAAAAWRRANPQLGADDALRAVDRELWHPSVKALVAQPEVLARMAESPQWLADLGEAYLGQPQDVQATVQQLRLRAQSNGSLRTDSHQYVYQQGETIVVQPAYPQVVYAPYYNPYVVYGRWWWPAYRPVFWRPWAPCPVIVTRYVPVVPLRPVVPVTSAPVRYVPYVRKTPPVFVSPYRPIPESRRAPIIQSPPPVRNFQPGAAAPRMAAPRAAGNTYFRASSFRGAGGGGGRHRS